MQQNCSKKICAVFNQNQFPAHSYILAKEEKCLYCNRPYLNNYINCQEVKQKCVNVLVTIKCKNYHLNVDFQCNYTASSRTQGIIGTNITPMFQPADTPLVDDYDYGVDDANSNAKMAVGLHRNPFVWAIAGGLILFAVVLLVATLIFCKRRKRLNRKPKPTIPVYEEMNNNEPEYDLKNSQNENDSTQPRSNYLDPLQRKLLQSSKNRGNQTAVVYTEVKLKSKSQQKDVTPNDVYINDVVLGNESADVNLQGNSTTATNRIANRANSAFDNRNEECDDSNYEAIDYKEEEHVEELARPVKTSIYTNQMRLGIATNARGESVVGINAAVNDNDEGGGEGVYLKEGQMIWPKVQIETQISEDYDNIGDTILEENCEYSS